MNTVFIDAGRFSSELALEQLQPVPDGIGGFTENWIEVATLWGRIEPVSDAARYFGGQPLEEITHRITLRSRDDMTSGMRLRKGTRCFMVLSVHDPDESGRYCLCRVREEGR
ncbi:phage head closure protein [Phyllobacterium leguminum]|uniref:SPP1 family predicted phage head-tail adaptor n=1 Tax=Phyllobacterium leguminum TaxID=314237 RepID=A0A318T7E6_9HYPH|nr:phage head closure protein [Phyllobacterium leguminum]PYE88387.1 SPP1 family predicted phage head-tail adaptor [Phyllobacterium leguminum]